MVSPSDRDQDQLLEGFTTRHWGVHDQMLRGGSWPTTQGGSLAATKVGGSCHRVHGWLLGRGSQPVARRFVYLDEHALFIIVMKTLVAGDYLF